MREVFQGWRRKVGSVTLVMACIFMSGWVRSQVHGDVLTFHRESFTNPLLNPFLDPFLIFASADDSIILGLTMEAGSQLAVALPAVSVLDSNEIHEELRDGSYNWHWNLLGFRYGEQADDFLFWIVPYWSIVLLLTLISAYLLSRKPQPKQ